MPAQAFSSLEIQEPFTAENAEERRETRQTCTDRSISTPGLQQQEHRGPGVCATQSTGATQAQPSSLLDEPWKVTLLPAAPSAEEPQERKTLPWRMGDVTRLKDDSPEGMMKYIATHSTGWWQEMTERALRDTEKARRMAEEQGWQPGQYWQLEVDAEAREKVLAAEEARRAREEAERDKEAAEKEAFAKKQMELLEKAGRAPRCEYQYTDGRGCKAPQVKGERWCHGHAKMMSYRPEKLEILPMEDEQAVMVNLYRVTQSLLSGRITEKVAGLTLWSIAIGAPGVTRISPQRTQRAQRKKNLPRIHEDVPGSKRKFGRELTRNEANAHEDHPGTPPHHANIARAGDPGVARGKSFESGVTIGSTLGAKVGESDSGENSLNRNRHNEHSRGPSTLPHSRSRAHGGSESLRMTRGVRRRISTEHGGVDSARQASVSPCLDGETENLTTKDTKEHEELPGLPELPKLPRSDDRGARFTTNDAQLGTGS